jgi:prepilin-type N-terminal cleavage/methylation domain-containing protein
MKRQRGVSLTEMLVCLVIIAIMVGLLSPVLSKTKASAKQVGDMSNMRQMYSAMQLYRNDNVDYPLRSNPSSIVKQYLGGTKLMCSSGKQGNYEYELFGPHDLLLIIGDKDSFDYYENCRRKREGQWPLIQDTNHMYSSLAYTDGGTFLLIVREAGNSEKIPGHKIDALIAPDKRSTLPCPNGDNTFYDINF